MQDIINLYYIKYYNQLDDYIDYLIINHTNPFLIEEFIKLMK